MRITHILLAIAAAASLSACVSQPGQPGMLETQSGRAVTGAVVGALIADNKDENMLAGAAIGAAGGALTCGIPGLPRCAFP